ncbi:GNAT family N-acetyltransferase [Paractinoplanes maris]|uniref:GNAT family N-acetyltransferase n=1 Tax=Paractinoplanes maris TaxID=1734446 RepID=UPI00201FDD2A|nr:GNAT family N-acetyltransferase [Actinoplanes maris]
MTLFCDVELAARLERLEADLIARGSDAARRRGADPRGFARPLCGGVASFADADSPLNKVAGLGFGGVPAAADLAVMERAFAVCGSPVQAEVSTLADPAIGELLTGRGYRLVSFENVLGCRLAPVTGTVSGVEVRRTTADEFDAWLELVADAFAVADTQGVASHEEFPRAAVLNAMRDMAAAGLRHYLATRDGVPAGGASMHVVDGVAQLTGAATRPEHRRRGVQSALLSARLADAADEGCDLAVVTTQPGSRSQHNVQRQGFDLLYTRAVLVKAVPA